MMKKIKLLSVPLICMAISSSAFALQFTIKNNLGASSPCPNGNTVTIFTGQSQPTINSGGSTVIIGDFSTMPGLGIQVNNWYWIQQSAPPQKNPQNPDNSGAQYTISKSCSVTGQSAAWYGKGIQTYLIADVTAAMDTTGGTCVVTISPNSYTNAVTPKCCAPPIFSQGVCTGPYGVTNSGQSWPPS